MSANDALITHHNGLVHSLRTDGLVNTLVDNGLLYGNSPILSVTTAASQYISVTTGAGVNTHVFLGLVATGQFQVNVYTGSTITVPGIIRANSPFNLTKPNISTLVLKTGVTATPLGTKIADFLLPGGSGGNAVGGMINNVAKIVLPPSTTFLFECTNQATNTQSIELSVTFYEISTGYDN